MKNHNRQGGPRAKAAERTPAFSQPILEGMVTHDAHLSGRGMGPGSSALPEIPPGRDWSWIPHQSEHVDLLGTFGNSAEPRAGS